MGRWSPRSWPGAVLAAMPKEVGVRPGWPAGLAALALAGAHAALVFRWSVTAPELATRMATAGLGVMALALLLGSTATVALASLGSLGGAVVGLDRPEGHAWGQILVLGLVWYLASEGAWESIEARTGTVRAPGVVRLRVREVSTVVAVAALVGLAGVALASLAPIRTAVVRGSAVAAVLAAVLVLGHHLGAAGRRPSPSHDPGEQDHSTDPAKV